MDIPNFPAAWPVLRLCAALIVSLSLGSCTEGSVAAKVAATPQCGDPLVVHTGRATFYTTADGGGNCDFDPTPNDLMVVALNTPDYMGSFLCGGSIRVTGPKGQVVVRIVDRCGGCASGDIDLSPQAFELIGDPSLGSVPVTWQLVAADVKGPIRYHFNPESNPWWTAVQVRNHRYPISSFEYLNAQGEFTVVERANYNYFVQSGGMGPGPYTFRVKDLYGHTLTDSMIVSAPGADVSGKNQFPECPP
jgi:expansin